jgi:hypothetical protein
VKAGLVETLSGDGPLLFLHRITLHLQNSGNGRNLVKPESLDKLKSVLRITLFLESLMLQQ